MGPVPVRHSLDPPTYRLRPVATRPWVGAYHRLGHSILHPMGPAFPAHYVGVDMGHGPTGWRTTRRSACPRARTSGQPCPSGTPGQRGDLVGAAPGERDAGTAVAVAVDDVAGALEPDGGPHRTQPDLVPEHASARQTGDQCHGAPQ